MRAAGALASAVELAIRERRNHGGNPQRRQHQVARFRPWHRASTLRERGNFLRPLIEGEPAFLSMCYAIDAAHRSVLDNGDFYVEVIREGTH